MDQTNTEPTEEELEKAAAYATYVLHEIEQAVIGEVEKIEGHVPSHEELTQHGRHMIHKDMSQDFYWKGIFLVSMNPNAVNDEGQRGTKLVIHQQPERDKK